MIQSRSIFCEKYVTFHGPTQYDFVDGITVLRGENRSGKSVLFSGLGNLLFGSPPIIQAKNKAKQMHVRGGSTFSYSSIVDGHELEISQQLVGQSLKYSIAVDGKDKGTHTQNAFFEILSEFIPVPEDLFYTSFYISGARPNPMHLGTGAQRMGYLQNMFDFSEKFDSLRARLSELLEESSQAVAEAEALKAERRSLPGGQGWSQNAYDKVDNALLYFKRQSSAASRNAKYHGEVESLEKVPGAQHSLDALMDKLKTLDARITEISELTEESEQAEEGRSEYRAAIKLQSQLNVESNKLRKHKKFKIFSVADVSELRVAQNDCLSDLHSKKIARNMIQHCVEINLRLEKALAKAPKGVDSTNAIEFLTNISKIESRIRRSVDELEESLASHSGLSKGDKCPTCGQVVKAKFDAKAAKVQLKTHRESLSFIRSLNNIGDYSKEATEAALEAAESQLEKAKVKHRKAEELSSLAVLWKEKSDQTKEVNATVKRTEKYAETKTDTKRLTVTLEKLKEQRREIKAAIEARSRIDALNEIISKESDTSLSPDALSMTIEVLLETKSEARALAKAYKRKEQIEKRLKELGHTVKYQDVLKATVDAYGPRGIRVDHMTKIAMMLERSFNEFSPCIFPEPSYFSFNVAPSNVVVGVERNALPPSDAALLSGSEARCFQVLCYAALTPYIPARYRFDSVVLDELESMMTPATRKLFIETAIPQIAQSVRSLTIVTPLPEEEFFLDDVRTVHVIKENSRSRLEIMK